MNRRRFHQAGFLSPVSHTMALVGFFVAVVFLLWNVGSALLLLWGASPVFTLGFLWLVVTLVAYERRNKVLGKWLPPDPGA